MRNTLRVWNILLSKVTPTHSDSCDKSFHFSLADQFKKISPISLNYNLTIAWEQKHPTHTIAKKIHSSEQNKNVKHNFQRYGFCTEFYSCHGHKDMGAIWGGYVRGPKSLSSRRVQTQYQTDKPNTNTSFYPRVINKINITFSSDELGLLNKVLKYNICKKKRKQQIGNVALEAKTAITLLTPQKTRLHMPPSCKNYKRTVPTTKPKWHMQQQTDEQRRQNTK